MKRIGILREGKVPQDSRVVLSPTQIAAMRQEHPEVSFRVQPSPHRCYADEEYRALGIELSEDLSDCELLLGVKEVPINQLIEGKTYCFFSHTIKKQPYNRKLLQEVLARRIELIDWETLTNEQGVRVIAFGRWAGIVGGHNALWTWGKRSGQFNLPRAIDLHDYQQLQRQYTGLALPPFKMVLTGGGRVAHGAEEVLQAAGVHKVSHAEFLKPGKPERAVYTAVDCPDFYRRKDGQPFEWVHYLAHPDQYESAFMPWAQAADVFINAIYWPPSAPRFFQLEDLRDPAFRIRVIADITCDLDGSVPTTVRATTIDQPLYGIDMDSGRISEALFGAQILTTMSIDNLPNELPRDASEAFGAQFVGSVWPELLREDPSPMLNRATIARGGALCEPFRYLQDYVDGAAAPTRP
jgi:saccharopine dehydrogenase (NAD+, L-lysine-forming)